MTTSSTRSLTDKPIERDTVYEGGQNERVQIAVSATGGTFTVTFGAQTTGALAYNISANNFEAALEDLSSIPEGAVEVTGGPGNAGATTPYVIEFVDELGEQDVGAVTTDAASLTGGSSTAVVTVLQQGSTGRIVGQHLSDVITDPNDPDAVQVPDASEYPTANATELDPLSVHDDDSPADHFGDNP